MMFNRPMEQNNELPLPEEVILDQWFSAYREACREPEASVHFMPAMWAKIEARESSANLFGRMAKALVTVAIAATVVMGMLVSTASQPNTSFTGSYLEAAAVDHVSALEPLNLDRISEMEQQ